MIDAKNGITSTNYDAVGNLAKITDSVGNSTIYTYDVVNRLLTDINQLGFSHRYGYDAVGNRVEMIDPTFRSFLQKKIINNEDAWSYNLYMENNR